MIPRRDQAAWRVPGRIEVLGKHTDYAGGNVLVGAVDRGVSALAQHIDGQAGELTATTTTATDPVRLRAGQAHGLPAGHWGRYLQTVLDRLTSNFGPSVPAHLTITSDLPPASGMSSSSALVCACALALADLNGWTTTELWERNVPDRLSLAGYLAGVEAGRPWRELLGAEGVGTQGGSEDHTGMLCGQADTLLLARFDPMEIRERVPFPSHWSLVVGVSGVLAEKTGAALEDYNRGPRTLRSVLARWNESTGREDTSLSAVLRLLVGEATGEEAAGSRELDRLLDLTDPGYERRRVEQLVIESLVLVPAGAQAVAAGDAGAVGEVLARSHALADSHLLNQVPQTNAMVDLARDLGAIGASAFGAGWGGSVYAVVPATDAEDFAAQWLTRYQREAGGPASATTIVTRPGTSASRLD
ncbi:galactokinase family protein [Actinomyces faecalis]|uniref:galactokinase family protein n=1 Tax=Actinomyces faecalis TaxID=2722820 RepID=UPI001C5547AE|nr:galactokinase family protein [Actinomyces faecalis]